jgi:hypothetical protein
MRVCLTVLHVHALAQVEDSVDALVALLEQQCDSIAACEVYVKGTCVDGANPVGCMVRLALHVFGEQISVTATNSLAGDEAPLQSALQNTYCDAVTALQLMARTHRGCSCHSAEAA